MKLDISLKEIEKHGDNQTSQKYVNILDHMESKLESITGIGINQLFIISVTELLNHSESLCKTYEGAILDF